MDCSDGLMLNILSSNDGPAPEKGIRGKKTKWKERRLEQRKQRNNRKTRPRLLTEKSEDGNEKLEQAAVKNEERQKNPASGHKFQVVSSLFRHNPAIPEIPSEQRNVTQQQAKEKLFSGNKFSDLDLTPYMISNLEDNLKLSTLTSVQKAAIPTLLEGSDAFVKSNTGSGKTLAYAIPLIHSLQTIEPKIMRCDGPYALILVPTRELALQSFEVVQKLVKPFQWVVPGIVTGGEKRKSEKARLRKGINVLVATPGRLLDHIQKTECLHLKKVRWVVLDEADRLLDMGFDKEVSAILTSIKQSLTGSLHKCQTVLLSATLSKGVENLAGLTLQDPVLVDVAAPGETEETTPKTSHTTNKMAEKVSGFKTPDNLQQFFIIVPSKLRLVTLAALLLWKYKDTKNGKMIVFLASRDSVDFHADLLSSTLQDTSSGTKLAFFKLHGNMSQTERTQVFKKFADAKNGILCCTDVAARGLDLPDVSWIIQYNTPGRPADYIHRVGRTARIGLQGNALVFLTPVEVEYLKILENHGISPQEMSVDQVLKSLESGATKKRTKGGGNNTAKEAATGLQLKMEEYVLADKSHMQLARTAFQSFVRSYATYPAELKHIFHVKNLHLGHVAKSFGLRDAPTDMFNKKQDGQERVKNRDKPKKGVKRKMVTTEHSSGKSLSGPLPSKKGKHKKSSKRS